MTIDTINTKSGDLITFDIDVVNNNAWYRITQTSRFSSCSYYDGNDMDRAKEIYSELKLAFQGLSECEKLNNIDIQGYVDLVLKNNQYYQQLKSKDLFLGISEF